ncbi:MAG: ATP-binding protein [bacterium]
MLKKYNTIEIHIPSVLGYEKVAMDSAAAVARLMQFHQSRIDDLRTAVSEACTNAMEHGNRLKKNTMVLVTLRMGKKSLEVNVEDQGQGVDTSMPDPRIEHQLNNCDDTRGWGMFLIKNLVDEVEFKKLPRRGNVTRMVIHLNR